MKIELVCPAAEDTAFLKSLAVAILAGLTPADVALSLKDDIVRRLDPERDLDFDADLAAITVSTKAAARAYELAAAYRRRGVKVVLGGIHPTAAPDEAAAHCDAVVEGEAEGLWERVVADARRGALQPRYRHEGVPADYRQRARPRWELFRSPRYVPVYTVQTARGCPFGCEFCTVTPFFGSRLRCRDVADVVAEIEALDRRWILFADDDILGQRAHGRRLLRELAPLGLTWFGQASLRVLEDEGNVRALAAAGCKALFVGFESVSEDSLAGCGKHHNHPARYVDVVRRVHDHGIAVWASFVLGLDHDGPDIFDRTLELARRAELFVAQFAIQCPYPGTPLHARLEREGRLLRPRWWLSPRAPDFPLYRPARMTPEQLHRGWQRVWREFYGAGSILSRARRAASTNLFAALAFLPLNLHLHNLTRHKIVGGERFFWRDR